MFFLGHCAPRFLLHQLLYFSLLFFSFSGRQVINIFDLLGYNSVLSVFLVDQCYFLSLNTSYENTASCGIQLHRIPLAGFSVSSDIQ